MDSYYTTATAFCSWLKQLDYINEENAECLIVKIMELYAASSSLTYPEIFTDTKTPSTKEALTLSCATNLYWEIFDPFILDEPVCGNLLDDLFDIYNDLLQGIYLYEQGKSDEAIWCWKWNFDNHWKYHATDAIRALCRIN